MGVPLVFGLASRQKSRRAGGIFIMIRNKKRVMACAFSGEKRNKMGFRKILYSINLPFQKMKLIGGCAVETHFHEY
jgi:hypothetical protein